MSTYDFTHSADRSGDRSEKWSKANLLAMCGNADALPFWVADMDISVFEGIKAGLYREADIGVIGYRDNSGLASLFTDFMKEKHDTVLDEDHVTFAQGMLHAISLAMNIFTKPGDRILLPYPSYHPFIEMIEANGRVIVPLPLKRTSDGFVFDPADFKKADEDCQAILFCSPHNPTGIVFSQEELGCVLETAKERGQLVLCDEIHSDMAHPGYKHIPMVKANEAIGARCISFCAASKSFNIAGEHCAFALFSDKAMKEEYTSVQKRLYLSSPGYSAAVMAEAAYKDGLDYNKALCEALAAKSAKVGSFIKERCPELRYCAPHASFIAFIDCSAIRAAVEADKAANPGLYSHNDYLMASFFGARGGICMNDGSMFGSAYSDYVRFNFGCGDELLEKGLEGLEKALKTIR